MSKHVLDDPSILCFIEKIKHIFENETYDYSFYDFEREEIKEKNKLYNLLEQINTINNTKKQDISRSGDLHYIYFELNNKLQKYEITKICNIKYGRRLKYKNKKDIPIQLYEGYYYSFTINYRKRI
jgi:hypothetical protein